MHNIDKYALATSIIGAGSWAGSILALGLKLPLAVSIVLIGFGCAGQAASQYIRIIGAPSNAPSNPTIEQKGP